MITSRQICRAIKTKFLLDVELVKGEGYFYFVDASPDSHFLDNCFTTSVMVVQLNHLDLSGWLDEFAEIMKTNI